MGRRSRGPSVSAFKISKSAKKAGLLHFQAETFGCLSLRACTELQVVTGGLKLQTTKAKLVKKTVK